MTFGITKGDYYVHLVDGSCERYDLVRPSGRGLTCFLKGEKPIWLSADQVVRVTPFAARARAHEQGDHSVMLSQIVTWICACPCGGWRKAQGVDAALPDDITSFISEHDRHCTCGRREPHAPHPHWTAP